MINPTKHNLTRLQGKYIATITNQKEKALILTDINWGGVVVKDKYKIKCSACNHLADKVKCGDVIEFSALVKKQSNYALGYKIGSPFFVKVLRVD